MLDASSLAFVHDSAGILIREGYLIPVGLRHSRLIVPSCFTLADEVVVIRLFLSFIRVRGADHLLLVGGRRALKRRFLAMFRPSCSPLVVGGVVMSNGAIAAVNPVVLRRWLLQLLEFVVQPLDLLSASL